MLRNALIIFPILFVLAAAPAVAQTQLQPVDNILRQALAKAARENKKVLVIFRASWCGWCRVMDSSISDAKCKGFFNRNYEIVHLTVMETAPNKKLENPGAVEYYNKVSGNAQGIPFWLVLDQAGNIVADSNYKPGENSGCPARPEEVAYFLSVLKRTSSITPEEAEVIRARFLENQR